MNRTVALLLAALIVPPVYALGEKPKIVGKLKDVEGLVRVFVLDQSINAFSGASLVVGTSIVTSSTGFVTLVFDEKCEIKMKPNQSLAVKDGSDCAALVPVTMATPAALTPVAVAPVAGATVGFGSGLGVILGGAAIGIILENQNKEKTSGS